MALTEQELNEQLDRVIHPDDKGAPLDIEDLREEQEAYAYLFQRFYELTRGESAGGSIVLPEDNGTLPVIQWIANGNNQQRIVAPDYYVTTDPDAAAHESDVEFIEGEPVDLYIVGRQYIANGQTPGSATIGMHLRVTRNGATLTSSVVDTVFLGNSNYETTTYNQLTSNSPATNTASVIDLSRLARLEFDLSQLHDPEPQDEAIAAASEAIAAEEAARAEGDAALDVRMSGIEAQLPDDDSGLAENIAANAAALAAEVAETDTDFITVIAQTAANQTAITTNAAAASENAAGLAQEVASREALDVRVTELEGMEFDTTDLEQADADLEQALADEELARTEADTDLEVRMSAIEAQLPDDDTGLVEAIAENAAALAQEVEETDSDFMTVIAQTAANQTATSINTAATANNAAAITQETADREASDAELDGRVTALENAEGYDDTALSTAVGEAEQSIADEVAAREAADISLSDRVATLEAVEPYDDAALLEAVANEEIARQEVDTEFDMRLAAVEAQLPDDDSGLAASIAANAAALAAEVDATDADFITVIAQTAANQTATATNATAASENAAGLAQEVADREAADTALQEQINGIEDTDTVYDDTAVVQSVADEEAARIQGDADLETRVAAVEAQLPDDDSGLANSIAANAAALAAEVEATDMDFLTVMAQTAANQTAISTNTTAASNNAADIVQESAERETADLELNARVTALENEEVIEYDDTEVFEAIADEEVARAAADAELDSRVAAVEAQLPDDDSGLAASIAANAAALATEVDETNSDFVTVLAQTAANQTAISTNAAAASNNAAAISTEASERTAADTELDDRVTALEAVEAYDDTDVVQSVADEEAARIAGDSDLDVRVTAIETQLPDDDSGLVQAIADNAASIATEMAETDADLVEVVANIAANQVVAQQANTAAVENATGLAEEITNRTTADTALNNALDAEEAARIAGDEAVQLEVTENTEGLAGLVDLIGGSELPEAPEDVFDIYPATAGDTTIVFNSHASSPGVQIEASAFKIMEQATDVEPLTEVTLPDGETTTLYR